MSMVPVYSELAGLVMIGFPIALAGSAANATAPAITRMSVFTDFMSGL